MNSIIEKIKTHRQEVKCGKVPKLKICPRCRIEKVSFCIHDRRERIFYVIEDCFIKKVSGLLFRLKCSLCEQSFTFYPEFILPFKRYVKAQIFELSFIYLQKPAITYRKVVLEIGYKDSGSMLSFSTLWNWLQDLGEIKKMLSEALDLLKQKMSFFSIFIRNTLSVFSRKYRSLERKEILEVAAKVIQTDRKWEEIFNRSFFPDFRTVDWWDYCKVSP